MKECKIPQEGRKTLGKLSEALPIVALVCVSALFVILFSYSTSPLYPNYYGWDYGGDSAQFLTVGKAWAEGLVPYRDIFDHKGPIIFFVDMLGFSLFGSKSGIAIFQIISLAFFSYAIYKISTLWRTVPLYGIFSVLLSLSFLKIVYLNGNTVEEYCLPFIGFSIYYIVSYLSNDSVNTDHPARYAFLYGVTFSVGLMTRITNVTMVCLGVLVITCILIYKRNFLNLLQNAIAFIVGFLVIFLPFYLYFSLQGATTDFWFSVLLFNMEYNSGMPSWLHTATSGDIASFIKNYLPLFLCVCSIYPAFKRSKPLAVLYSLWAIAEVYLFCSGSLFLQYVIVALPQVALFLNEIALYNDRHNNSIIYIASIAFLVSACYSAMCEAVPLAADYYQMSKNPAPKEYQSLIDLIPEEERKSFIAYGGNT